MADKVEGILEVGTNEKGDVVINHPDLKPDKQGVGHIVFSPNQARQLSNILLKQAAEADRVAFRAAETERIKNLPPVDRTARVLANGQPITDDHLEINPATGMQKEYVVLTPEERAKGFIRPVRREYLHVGTPPEGQTYQYPVIQPFPGGCGSRTICSQAIAETYARDPKFYSGTFCVNCRGHFPLDQFIWDGTAEPLGS